MTDLAVATTPFLDLTFTGLDALPRPGQERYSKDLHRSPGGGAITAVGAARLGLDAVLAGPLGSDAEAALLRESLEREGVRLVAPHGGRTATTVVLPAEGDRAMVTYDPGSCARAEDLEALNPRAIVCGLEEVTIVPATATAAVFLSLGDEEARALAGRIPDAFARANTVLVNEAEARLLTGAASAADAAEALAGSGASIVVTRGAHGAVGVVDGERIVAAGVDAGPALDTTGAGDLFTAAFIWAGLHGADPEDRLRWAVLYAALSVSVPTAIAGAATCARLVEEGTRLGLPALEPAVSGSSSKEGQ